jgi:hypothetical protein
MPESDFLILWGVEVIFGLVYLAGGIGIFISATRKNKPLLLLLAGTVLLIAGWVFSRDGWRISPMLLGLAGVLLFIGIRRFVLQKR